MKQVLPEMNVDCNNRVLYLVQDCK